MQHKKLRRGFTLIEVLVVVLIIGILAAIALPMYNKAVLRSRFNALMPIVKAMNDSNEAYYLEHGSYASNPQDLPVQGLSEYPTGTELEFGSNMDYAYVLATNASAKNNYIMYQKHSTNYPGEIHCEAITGDDLAEYICVSSGGTTNLGTTLTEGYTTYVISGSGAGIAPETSAGLDKAENGTNPYDCTKAEELGFTCTADEENGIKQICKVMGDKKICRTKTYNEDGSYTSLTCQTNGNNECTSYSRWGSAMYDASGNKISTWSCDRMDSSGNCTKYAYEDDYMYDANGNMLSRRQCSHFDDNGNCTGYDSSYAYDYTYDANGNKLSQRICSSVDSSSGNCTAYGSATYYTYDENGNMLKVRTCTSSTMDSNGNCTSYYAKGSSDYTYDANGNRISMRICSSVASNGNCTKYGATYNYTYDANGNKLTDRYCNSVDSGGNCMSYRIDNTTYDYTYDANGNMLSERQCLSVDSNTGNCTTYNTTKDYTYDDNGKQVGYQYCGSNYLNTATGECIKYTEIWTVTN